MLEGIDEGAFAKASHAYGKAKDVPDLLRGLAATSAAKREHALFNLSAAICHQGTLYSATALAVPHLLVLVASAKVKGRAGILRLLADIVTLDDHERFLLGYPEALPSDLPAAFKKAIVAVRKGDHVIATLLRDKEAEVRAAAAFLLAWLPRTNAPAVAEAMTKEKDEAVKASMILALGFLDPKESFTKELGAKSVAVKTAAALAQCTATGGKIDAKARGLIVQAAAKKKLEVDGMFFIGGDLAPFAVQVLSAIAQSDDDVLDAIVGAVEARGAGAQYAANVVVRKLFAKTKTKPPAKKYNAERRDVEEAKLLASLPVKAGELEPLQQRFVKALGGLDGFDDNLSEALAERGLPPSKELLTRWLEGSQHAPASILDRAVTHGGKKTTLGELYVKATVEAALPKTELVEAIEAHTSVDERFEVALAGLEVVEVLWSGNVAADLIWRNATKASKKAMLALEAAAKKHGSLWSVALGSAYAARALAAKKTPDPDTDKLLQQAYEYSVIAKRALAALPVERREKWILDPKRDDRAQPAEFFAGAWRYFDACPTTKIADRALAHVAEWKPKDPWGGPRKKNADPVLLALIEAFEAAGNHADAKRLAQAYATLK